MDGGLRATTALDLAIKASYEPLLEVDDINSFFDRSNSDSLEDYLEAFVHTTALMNTYENLERIAFEAAEDMHNNGINIYESRYAPLYSVNSDLSIKNVLLSINSGLNFLPLPVGPLAASHDLPEGYAGQEPPSGSFSVFLAASKCCW